MSVAGAPPAERLREMVRLTLPWDASVAVSSSRHRDLLEEDGRPAFLLADDRDDQQSPPDPITVLEALESKGVEYVVLGAGDPLLERRPEFRQYLEANRRRVTEERGATIYALKELEEPHIERGPDGLPFPPPEMIRLVAGLAKPAPRQIYERFFKSGLRDANVVRDALGRTSHAIGDFRSILDHGCGCGRVIRHFRELRESALHGSDYNPYLISWCQANLPFATFKANPLEARLDYSDETFDLVYAISVFTHLDRDLQAPWIDELTRVMRPAGLLVMTIFSSRSEEHLDPGQHDRFLSGELVVSRPLLRGTNACTAFHPEQYVRDTLANALDVVDWVPGAKDGRQDAVVLRKLAARDLTEGGR